MPETISRTNALEGEVQGFMSLKLKYQVEREKQTKVANDLQIDKKVSALSGV